MSLPGRFLNIAGHRVFYHRPDGPGRGRPLVLLHGFMFSHWTYRHIIPGLAARHDVIAIDLPGHGESDRPSPGDYGYDAGSFMETVIGVLDELGLERASLMGHSMGGGIALHVAARRPERVDKVVALAPVVYPFPVPLEGRVILAPYVGPFILKHIYTRSLLRRILLRDVYRDPSFVTEEWVDYVWERINRPGGFDAVRSVLRLLYDPSQITRSLRAVRAPVLIVWGDEDHLIPPAGPRLTGDIPGAVAHLMEKCGHSPLEEQPDELMRLVLPFLDRGAGDSRRPDLAAVSA